MRFAVRIVPALLVVLMAIPASGQIIPGDETTYPSASIVNSPHNLNNYPGVSLPGNQICLPCHTPHNALLNDSRVLWNHAETTVQFSMYFSDLSDPGSSPQPEGPSKMCLSCHDGVTAIDNYGGNGGTGIVITGPRAFGSDLTDDHPIGIVYPTDRPTEYNDPTGFAPGINGGPGVRLVEIDGADRVECTSCHEPHNNGLGNFLRVPLLESYICLQCHIK